MVLMLGDEKGYDRLGEAGNWDCYDLIKRNPDKEDRIPERLEEEDPEMYYEFLEWEKGFKERHGID